MAEFNLNHPHPDHVPTVGRVNIGMGFHNRTIYGTTLRCSCGTRWGKIINSAPSAGGRKWAQQVYFEHISEAIGG